MTAGLLYALLIGLALSCAAALLEEPVRRANGSTRGLWLGALIATVLVPVALWYSPLPPPVGTAPILVHVLDARGAAVPGVSALTPPPRAPDAKAGAIPLGRLDLAPLVGGTPLTERDGILLLMTRYGPLAVLLALGLDSLRFARRRRRWHAGSVDGRPVFFSADFGPAIVGLVRPSVVLPTWVEALDAEDRALVLAHEWEHLRAHDPRVLALAYVAIAITPWNPVLWWQLRRLRAAIELDCDRRVVGASGDDARVERYATLLLETNQRARPEGLSTIFTAAFAERGGALRRRIIALTESSAPFVRAESLSRLAAVVAMALCIAGVRPPTRDDLMRAALASNRGDTLRVDETFLPPFAADTVLTTWDRTGRDNATPPVGIAHDLPERFVPDTVADKRWTTWGGCPEVLRDPRDSTQLHVRGAYTTSESFTIAGMSAAVSEQRFGYYMVVDRPRYGLTANTRLRVSCPPLAPVDTAADRPARRIVESEIRRRFNWDTVSVVRHHDELDVTLGSELAYLVSEDADEERAHTIADLVWQVYPHASELRLVEISYSAGPHRSRLQEYSRQDARRVP